MDEIRLARAAWNAAIAAQDAGGAVTWMTRDAVLIPAGGDALKGRAAIQRAWRNVFAGGGRYVRTPDRIEPDADGLVVAEAGTWRGQDKLYRMAGCYLAEWHNVAGEWLCARELYVELSREAVA